MSDVTHRPQRHHFVPQFLLREWYETADRGFWLYFRDPQGRVRLCHRHAKSIAYVKDLYAINPDGMDFRQSPSNKLEDRFFAPIDDAASIVHQKLLTSGLHSLSPDDRIVWAIFVNSLLERLPKRIQVLEAQFAGLHDESIAATEREYPGSTTQPAIKAILAKVDKTAVVRNAVLSGLVRYIMDEPFIRYIASMEWLTLSLADGADHFLTGDTPVIVNGGGLSAPIYLLSIAVSPQKLLVMRSAFPAFDADFVGRLTLIYNILLAQQTDQYLVSSRQLADSRFIKYRRIVDAMLGAIKGQGSP